MALVVVWVYWRGDHFMAEGVGAEEGNFGGRRGRWEGFGFGLKLYGGLVLVLFF